MQSALALAARAIGLSDPNPRVGCVIADGAGNLVGCGFTQQPGGPHAEIMALRDASKAGKSTTGATAFVTLEPCSHQGRTGPCCESLIEAGIAKVVASIADPNPLVSGQGFTRLRAAGIEVEVGPGAAESRELNIGFFSRMVRKKPWVRMKIAASLDGTTALENGKSQWITAAAAREDGHAWRQRASAVLTGIGTVLEDDPRLTVRLPGVSRQPALVIVDSRLETPIDARLWSATNRRISIYGAVPEKARAAALEQRGSCVTVLPDPNGKVDLAAMLADLAKHEVNELHVEAGHKLNGSLIRADLVDEFLIYVAPKPLGQGRGMTNLGPLSELASAVDLEFVSTSRVDVDLRIVARVAGRDRF
ncbi:MAG: bifunctional diaminohydroxyphosphoribosylaminopyrimidine deaminase/5-amino-6-(5-phosphoribosylamino)uracil reductase RibD [Burkholderiales bacterium]